jgi:hypothetical protein
LEVREIVGTAREQGNPPSSSTREFALEINNTLIQATLEALGEFTIPEDIKKGELLAL